MNNFFFNVLTFSIAPLLSSFQISYSFYPYEGSPFPFHPPKDMHISPSGTHRTDTEVDYTGEYECSSLPHDLCGTIKACEMPFNYVVSHYGCGDGASLAWNGFVVTVLTIFGIFLWLRLFLLLNWFIHNNAINIIQAILRIMTVMMTVVLALMLKLK